MSLLRVDFSQDSSQSRSTQLFGDANELLYMPNEHDEKHVSAGQYESSEELEEKRQLEQRVIMIQRNYRRYRLQVCVRRCAAEYRRLMAIKKKQAERDKQDYINSNMNCKDFPKTKRDFDILFSQIAEWKEQEVRYIESTASLSSCREWHKAQKSVMAYRKFIQNENCSWKREEWKLKIYFRFLTVFPSKAY